MKESKYPEIIHCRHAVSSTGDVGGYMGLLLGASIISLVELLDYIMMGFWHQPTRNTKKHKGERDHVTNKDKERRINGDFDQPIDEPGFTDESKRPEEVLEKQDMMIAIA